MDSHFEQMLSCIQLKGNKCKQSIEQKTELFLLYISITIKLRVEYIAHICSQWSSVWTLILTAPIHCSIGEQVM